MNGTEQFKHRAHQAVRIQWLGGVSTRLETRKFIAHAWNSNDQSRALWIMLQFLTQVGNMNIHSPSQCSVGITPDCAQKFLTREGGSGSFDEILKKFKL